MQCNEVSWRSAKGKVKGPGEQLGKTRRCTSCTASPAPLLAMGRRSHGDVLPSLLFPVPPKADPQLFATCPRQHLRKRSWIFLSSPLLGLLLHSVLPPFIIVSKSTTLAGPGTRRTTRGVTSAAPATLLLFDVQLLCSLALVYWKLQSGSELWP